MAQEPVAGNRLDHEYWLSLKNLPAFERGLTRVRRDYYLDIVKDGQSFLDLGCGFGETYSLFRQNGIDIDYTGIDLIPVFIDTARERYPEARFEMGRIQEIPYPDNSFDVASARCVLEHLPDPAPAIEEMARVAGMVVIVWFKWPGETEAYKYDRRGFWENQYKRETILDIASSADLKLTEERTEKWHRVWILE